MADVLTFSCLGCYRRSEFNQFRQVVPICD